MKGIYVWFEYAGKEYYGYLESVCGAGAMVYHLMVDRFYWGRLRQTANSQWVLDTNQKGLGILADDFGYWVSTPINIIFQTEYDLIFLFRGS